MHQRHLRILGRLAFTLAAACEANDEPVDTVAESTAGMSATATVAGTPATPSGAAGTVGVGGTGGSADRPASAGTTASNAGSFATAGSGVSEPSGMGGGNAPQAGVGGSIPPDPSKDPVMPVACPGSAPARGETTVMLTHDGIARSFILFIPESYDNTKPFPLVLNFHGNTQSAAQQVRWSKMNPTAEAKGFIVVYPEGLNAAWDAGACCASRPVDDVGFARAIVEYMQEHACIDPRRIYSTGFSNGGRLTYRLGCEAADIFAAIAPVAGTKSFPVFDNTPGCKPSRPISLIDFQGTADTSHIRYQAAQIEEWVEFNGCTDSAPKETYRKGDHSCSTYSQCKEGTSVTFCVVPDGGHCWPGSYPCVLGDSSMPEELSANELMWELFERSTL